MISDEPHIPSRWQRVRRFTPVFIFGGFFLASGTLLPWIGGPPTFDELVEVSGEVERIQHTPKTRYGEARITFVLAGSAASPIAFDSGLCYAGARGLTQGSQVTAWLDGEPEAGASNYRAWQLRSNGTLLCDYEKNLEESMGAAANARVMGGTFALIGIGLLVMPFFIPYTPDDERATR
jgi:hypothetical protein